MPEFVDHNLAPETLSIRISAVASLVEAEAQHKDADLDRVVVAYHIDVAEDKHLAGSSGSGNIHWPCLCPLFESGQTWSHRNLVVVVAGVAAVACRASRLMTNSSSS